MARREKSPESAAQIILKMVASKKASSAQDAVNQRPELRPGLDFLGTVMSPQDDVSGQQTVKSTGSGPMLLER